ncbi:hypothetical protein [Leptothermofonsia sp. ETS-13]|uniref:hypothetical protein n=1 Tax=Leptothermofonsia sp. ETS-13 TaxID=3035696 RepID=UPI003B9DDA72
MKHWEFLLQKDGDRSWLPLDSSNIEILEGRYRVVARSSQKNTEVEVRISHLVLEENPPKRRIQKRSARTNQDGLLVVIPYTRLEPGLWELCCSSMDLMSDLVGDAWQYTVKLQVSAKEVEPEEWDSPWMTSEAPNSDTSSGENHSSDVTQSQNESVATPSAMPAVGLESTGLESSNAKLMDEPPSQPVTASEPAIALNGSSDLPPEVAEILGASMDRLFQLAKQLSDRLVDEVMHDFDLTTMAPDLAPADSSPAEPSTPVDVSYQSSLPVDTTTPSFGYLLPPGSTPVLSLNQEAIISHRGEGLTISGQVAVEPGEAPNKNPTSGQEERSPKLEIADLWEPVEETLQLTGATLREIQLCLRDPQSLQVLVSDRQPISQQSPPFSFSFSFSLPNDLQTRLILGEVLLCGSTLETSSELTTLTTQAFTITVDPQELVGELEKINEALDETLAAQTEEDQIDRIDLPLELSQRLAKEQEMPSLNLSFLKPEPVETPPTPPRRFQYLLGQPLPPQIYHPNPDQPRTKPIELPTFIFPVNPQATTFSPFQPSDLEQADADSGQGGIESTVTAEPGLELMAEAIPTEPGGVSETEQATPTEPGDGVPSPISQLTEGAETESPIEQDRAESAPVPANEAQPDTPVIDLPSPVQMEFQSLKLQDRFLTRLSSLANDTELSEWLRSKLYPGKVAQTARNGSSKAEKVDRRAMEEVVVDDEPLPNGRQRQRNGFRPSVLAYTVEEPNPLILPPDEPVPTPVLEVTMTELVAGKPVNIRVKLPYLEPRIYVKLWLIDRQTRSLLDGPRWLLDFLPNSRGELEALTQLTVPFGSLEVLFEAIAIEMHTQRESHKVSLDRSIVPPDLPVVSLDDFDSTL